MRRIRCIGASGQTLNQKRRPRILDRRVDRGLRLERLRLDVRRLGALASFTGFEGDLLTLTQRLETLTGNV